MRAVPFVGCGAPEEHERSPKMSVRPLAVGALLLMISIDVSAAGAPSLQEGAKLIGTGAVSASYQGRSVALSADGNTTVVGGYTDATGRGAAWVYTRSGGVWSQQGAKLAGTGAVGAALLGQAVAISADGNTAVVGGPGDNGGLGATWVFTRAGGVWSQHGAKLVGSGAAGSAAQGTSVALSGDGATAIVGGAGDNAGTGAAWAFVDPAALAVMPPQTSPSSIRLAPPFPNPTTGLIAITFTLPREADVTIDVVDVAGRIVETLAAGTTSAGDHTLRWDGRTSGGRFAPGGIYYVALRADGNRATRRFALLR
jgi:hypothetical protein